MKKLATLAMLVFTTTSLMALPLGNPSDPTLYKHGMVLNDCNDCIELPDCVSDCVPGCLDWVSFRFGFYGDYVFNLPLEVSTARNSALPGMLAETTTIYTNAGYLDLNICNWIDVFATVGATHIHMATDGNQQVATNTNRYVDIDFLSTFSWSVGGRIALWECRNYTFGFEGQYFSTSPDLNYYKDMTGGVATHSNNGSIDFSSWQVGLGLSYDFTSSCCSAVSAIPYIGFFYADAKIDVSSSIPGILVNANTYTMRKYEAARHWGYAVGTTVLFSEAFSLAVEGRFAYESAVSVLGQMRF